MLSNYLILIRQFLILGYIKMHKFGTETIILHHRYYDFIFSGLFLHLLFKIFLYLLWNIQLYGTFNIILLLLSVYICTIIDICYYIYYILNKIIYYFLKYLHNIPAEFFYPYAPESEYMREILPFVYENPEAKLSENLNKERDRFFFLKPIFLFLIALRYFILREPLLFTVIHVLIFVNYLQDFNLTLLFLYLLILHLSRFIFFMGPDYERFRAKRWLNAYVDLINQMPRYKYDFFELSHLNTDTYVTYDLKIMPKFTLKNINLMMYFALKKQLSEVSRMRLVKSKLSELYDEVKAYDWIILNYQFTIPYIISNKFYNFCWYIPQIFDDCQRFVKKNQFFWLAFFVLILYFENILSGIMINILTTAGNEYISIEPVINDIYTLFSFDIVEVYEVHFKVTSKWRLWSPFSVEYIYEIARNIYTKKESVIDKLLIEFKDPRFLGKAMTEEMVETLRIFFDLELRNLDTYERPRTFLEYVEYRIKRRLMWIIACAFYYFMVYVPMLLDYLVIIIEYIQPAIEYIKKIIEYIRPAIEYIFEYIKKIIEYFKK